MSLVANTCPRCGERLPHDGGPAMGVGRVLSLFGGLLLVAAYVMPWFSADRVILTGSFLSQFLLNTTDLRRFLPGSTGGTFEVQLIRLLVYAFPGLGLAAAATAIYGWMRPANRRATNIALGAIGAAGVVVWIVALIILSVKLPTASREIGLNLNALAAILIVAGVALDRYLAGPYPEQAGRTDDTGELAAPRSQPWEAS
ncbi:MAG: hypothetical protein U0821_27780 [Chloroflexota bacterium]